LPDPSLLPADLNGWLEYLERLHPKTIALGIERIGLVRDELGLRPDFPIITVAGTNGKGSTCAMLERIYIEAGYSVACYTSPHLLHYNERVRVDGQEASDAHICRAFAAVEHARQSTPLTYFEFGTLAAMRHFIDSDVDIAILEVGLGGRLDAVNIFDPVCAVITSIDLDHMDYLGEDRERIGREKASIYRQATPAICGDPDPPSSVRSLAAHIGAEYRQVGEDFSFESGVDEWEFVTRGVRIKNLPLPALIGKFQLYNASCAIQAIQELQRRIPVSINAIRAGLRHVALQGRFQVCAGLQSVILDVAHNPHAARGLAENLRMVPPAGRVLAVFAMLADKDIAGVVRALADVVDSWLVASIQHARGADASVLAGILHELTPKVPVQCFSDVPSAFRQACLSANENDKIVVFGSFYTVADVLRRLPSCLEN
jgi:dihydrofolate synthase / folylpolyglutamate synthase